MKNLETNGAFSEPREGILLQHRGQVTLLHFLSATSRGQVTFPRFRPGEEVRWPLKRARKCSTPKTLPA